MKDREIKTTVILPVYNGLPYLKSSIQSVLTQSLSDFEFIIINDGSKDSSEIDIKQFSDLRIRYFTQTNCSLATTLNRAIALSNSDYIARIDQDDIMMPTRLDKQLKYMKQHPEVAMVGTWSKIIKDNHPTLRNHTHAISDKAIKLELLFDNPFVHSSIMIRKSVLDMVGGYCEDKSRQPPEDYELWSRISRNYKLSNIPEYLMEYREVDTSMSRTGVNPFLENVTKISSENLYYWLKDSYSLQECLQLSCLYHGFRSQQKSPSALSKRKAIKMYLLAVDKISENIKENNTEFNIIVDKQLKQIKSRFLYSYIPSFLKPLLKSLRNKVLGKG
ncbi:glycosyltransferase family A protein [Methylophilus glucosoxydans]|uniref:Glycosyltransferase family A protein n=1 Tax=Methylophilus glucosoxydans TaxID=752553 RepID=A0ABW3GIB4_9PROT